MDFPTIHTNFWDAVIAVPAVMILTQVIKKSFKIKKKYIPFAAVVLGYAISIFISHRGNLLAGIIMGYFYGYAAIGSYASLKTAIIAYKKKAIVKKFRKQLT
ncbi:phage holin family protein [Niallia endozanthoxylica]|uniref:Uncharacterized protein n=1 Tax=Niallia endozanthoxylica TaxID=2036016 RepID=A0A5J5HBM3_9BACI|nr:phage holin family protein [Niallia endozanthoxylica]KAA9018059.1 hypothetical protein F4V44_20625 [Niallia endozanthoxylica]